jgi:hypothetical protein
MFGILGLIQRTTHVMFEPLDFIAGLAPLVTKPRVNLPGCPGHPGHLDRHCGNYLSGEVLPVILS